MAVLRSIQATDKKPIATVEAFGTRDGDQFGGARTEFLPHVGGGKVLLVSWKTNMQLRRWR